MLTLADGCVQRLTVSFRSSLALAPALVTPRAERRSRRLAAQPLVLDLALELLQRAAQVPAHRGRRDLLGDPAQDPGAGDAVGQAQLDVGVVVGARAQPPAPALVDAGDRRPREVAALVPFDDLDQAADLGRADAHERAVARAHPRGLRSPSTSQRVTPAMKCR